ncbi:hypothetical protein SCLCIDRAFT_27508 [Scleroderma citrinum Foug A]|uniref:Uncharacterized protein n=1 Tax=Scleroderma citrinum Foug A TaxID=1036808 RepID=A0A0C3DTH7_9AGAM|nr:hypothetical protein SCLCIDRAFT_27508 [Scleroderma citrinum Foug A]
MALLLMDIFAKRSNRRTSRVAASQLQAAGIFGCIYLSHQEPSIGMLTDYMDGNVIQCSCGRTFAQLSAYTNHQRTCKKRKKRLSGALAKAKLTWDNRKRRRMSGNADEHSGYSGTSGIPGPLDTDHVGGQGRPQELELEFSHSETNRQGSTSSDMPVSVGPAVVADDARTIGHNVEMLANDSRSLAERHSRHMSRRLPARYRDILPQPPPPPMAAPGLLPPLAEQQVSLSPTSRDSALGSRLLPRTLRFFTTLANSFGLSRWYYGNRFPTHDAEDTTTLQHLTLTLSVVDDHDSAGRDSALFYPYLNRLSYLLGDWYWNGGIQKSKESFRNLIKIVGNPEFWPGDVNTTRWDFINAQLRAGAEENGPGQSFEGASWTKTAVTIKVPFHKRTAKPGVYNYHVGDMYHRTLISVIREKLANLRHDELFHYQPYNLLWQRGGSPAPINVHGELYTSQAFLQTHKDLQQSPPEPGCDLERVIVALMFWLDATQLTTFGNTKLWPCYMFFGNESKYRRCKPSCCLCSHIAYFNHLPDSFKDFATEHFGGKAPPADFMAHCHRELFHTQWGIILDDEFLEVWEHGIVIRCCDGVERRFYPRIFTYSADYPEKQSKIQSARTHIYDSTLGVTSTAVESLLKDQSLVPTSNTFSNRLSCLGFNLFCMLVVDLMHEFELGIWKALFTHLICILNAAEVGDILVNELDHRYRMVPTFGSDTIRKFASNTSEMKRMAACDFEDVLQIPLRSVSGNVFVVSS